ncbi:MAG TPA: ABC transporter permease [Euzebya sp.]|nr:ABC transporter permease [Euzebya sp.]
MSAAPPTVRAPAGTSAGRWLGGRSVASNIVIKAASVVVLLLVWQLISATQGLLPGPIAVGDRLINVVLHENYAFHLGKTMFRVLAGLLFSMVLATLIGIPMGLFRFAERFFETYVLVGLTIPGLAWALLAVMIVGINDWAPILAITVTTTPMIILNLWQGTKGIDMGVLEMSKAFRANRRLVIRHVVLPQLLPFLMAGVRLGLALAWKIVVLSELFGLSNGVGYQLNLNFASFSLDGVLAWTIAFTFVMGLIEFVVIRPIDKRVTRWRPDVQGA